MKTTLKLFPTPDNLRTWLLCTACKLGTVNQIRGTVQLVNGDEIRACVVRDQHDAYAAAAGRVYHVVDIVHHEGINADVLQWLQARLTRNPRHGVHHP